MAAGCLAKRISKLIETVCNLSMLAFQYVCQDFELNTLIDGAQCSMMSSEHVS